MTANVVRDLPDIVCNRFGEEMNKGILQKVTHCPSMRCNVFSITKLLLEVWNLGGNKYAIWLEKNKRSIAFDIKLKKSEVLFFVCISNGKKVHRKLVLWLLRWTVKGTQST